MYEMSDTAEKKSRLSRFLKKAYWEWQAGDPGKTRTEWAVWIHPELGEATIGHWMNQVRLPGELNAYRLATRYPEVLDILEMEEEELQFILAAWPRLEDNQRRMIMEQAEQYLIEKDKGDVKGAVGSTS